MISNFMKKIFFIITSFIVVFILLFRYYFMNFNKINEINFDEKNNMRVVDERIWQFGWIDNKNINKNQEIIPIGNKLISMEIKKKKNINHLDVEDKPFFSSVYSEEVPVSNIRYLGFSYEESNLIVFLEINGDNKAMKIGDVYNGFELVSFNDYNVVVKNLNKNIDQVVLK
ncbi:hypothetical protein [Acinetobacter bereziniae]|uniref:hypothetical protein n=1 Tax=Acinetobacter bereziniae TaxID=106648 RepID=UPI0012505AFC|nr:hypothetical protein [Acinetobacter bereziniae]